MSNYLNILVYKKNGDDAKAEGALDLFRESYKANIACATKIEQAIKENYHENHLDTEKALDDVLTEFSKDRIEYVLAKTVQYKHYDGRFQECNKNWAGSVQVTELPTGWGTDRTCNFVVETHPVLTDAFVTRFCKRFELGEYAGKENK